MRQRHWVATTALVIPFAAFLTTRLAAQRAEALRADTSSFVTVQGKDTVAIEQYVRIGNMITGAWIQHQGGVYRHDYSLVLRDDGWPAQYVMTLYTSRPHTFLLSVTYGSDSATRIMVRDSIAVTERVVTQKAFPQGALSVAGLALALERVRRMQVDSTAIPLDRAEIRGVSPVLPVKFFGSDSARIGTATWARVDRDGRLLELREGPRNTRRVSSLPVPKLLAGFVSADSAARAARIAITLPPSVLQRFVGEYSLNPRTIITIALDGDRLVMHTGQQPPAPLLAASPTTFFLEAALGLTFEFEGDGSGAVTALTLVQGSARQRAVKTR
jgi:hypothetical protein